MEGNGFHMNPFVESVFGTKQGFHGMSHTVWAIRYGHLVNLAIVRASYALEQVNSILKDPFTGRLSLYFGFHGGGTCGELRGNKKSAGLK